MDLSAWRAQRLADLTAADSWLSLVGLYWLEPGPQTLGSANDNALVLPCGPAHWGVLHVNQDGTVLWQAQGQAAVSLATDRDGKPDVVRHGDASFILIERDGQVALRLRDNAAPARLNFPGLDYFPEGDQWRIAARWEAAPQTLEIASMSGGLEARQVSGQALFRHGDKEYRLIPLDEDAQGLFFVFADGTSGKKDGNGSYGAGRFLRADPPVDGRLVLDFNRAYNPPCAFTPFATCPLAPPENRLPFAVMAGEKYPLPQPL
ncbi:MAG: DUF1684 domain-containing protein [Rhodocyclaceae bacterium]|nr:MAG: DUF1684 domain-containing protein [Rhodocyclaceae bacterium]